MEALYLNMQEILRSIVLEAERMVGEGSQPVQVFRHHPVLLRGGSLER